MTFKICLEYILYHKMVTGDHLVCWNLVSLVFLTNTSHDSQPTGTRTYLLTNKEKWKYEGKYFNHISIADENKQPNSVTNLFYTGQGECVKTNLQARREVEIFGLK